MSLGLMMHANWDRMNSGQLQHYKTDRPVYSTPHPVQSTPANNECKLVELRGADVASFLIGDEEYICLPQVFDLFLKHLVGGLHTVYTKLKRLDITPVVCNVEQVRVLRGLGAIQPGVNRCKLITRKDFESLYRDCTTASRPGRPPKRYSIPSTPDLMSYHNEQQPANALRGMMNTTDVRNFHKRMRMEREASFDQHQSRLSTSPTRRSPPAPDKYLSRAGAGDLYANAANIYLQQALRHQYQQFIANGLQNGANFQHTPELAPFVGMAKTGFNSAIQPSFLAQFEEQRRKELRYFSSENKNISNELNLHSSSEVDQRQENLSTSCSPISRHGDKKISNSPKHAAGSPTMRKRGDDVNNSFSHEEKKHSPDLEYYQQTFFDDNKTKSPKYSTNHDTDQIEPSTNDKNSRCLSDDEPPRSPAMDTNISSMQTLLSNIQGLLKVAADNAKFQEKQMSFELAEMRNRLEKEQELREETERRLEESKRITASMQRKLDYERETRRRLQEQKLIAQEALTKVSSTEDNRSSPESPRFQSVQQTESSTLPTSNMHSSVKPTSSPELSPISSSSCLVSPCSVDEYSSTRNSRCSVSAENDNGHRSNRSTPGCNVDSPVNMTKEQKEWIPCDVAQ